ncbi:MAG: T9SS type A sorting domain-containing protein [Flavobacteriales bacterium]|nr:T9SS type A sorting domain-containing protein [Flavobacteriales bacterium]MCB9363152.1 T9SS type A sorting domain-containing protein [Flavobacteriales bacterium]
MKTTLLSLFVFFTVSLSAQDWFPFPLGQTSYFGESNISSIFSDSIFQKTDTTIYYFSVFSDQFTKCRPELIQSQEIYRNHKNLTQPDSIFFINDSLIFFHSNHYGEEKVNCKFLPFAMPGDSWTSQTLGNWGTAASISISCDSIKIDTLLNNSLDSVKFFSANGVNSGANQLIKLSKTRGFLTYQPLNSIYEISTPLIGYKNDSESVGYEQPTLQDYFHLNTEDIIIWRHYEDKPIPEFDSTYYFKDSIIDVFSSPDSVIYSVYRTYTNGQTNNLTYSYHKSKMTALFDGVGKVYKQNELEFQHNLFSNLSGEFSESSTINVNNGITTRNFSSVSFFLDTSDCWIQGYYDFGSGISINTKYGIFSGGYSAFENYVDINIQGSVINGVPEGILWDDITTSIEVNKSIPEIKIYPNPVQKNNIIIIEGKDLEKVEIITLQGKIVYQSKLMNNQLTIDINQGIYFLKVTNSKGESSSKKLIVN